jgi:hypothetical protein
MLKLRINLSYYFNFEIMKGCLDFSSVLSRRFGFTNETIEQRLSSSQNSLETSILRESLNTLSRSISQLFVNYLLLGNLYQ